MKKDKTLMEHTPDFLILPDCKPYVPKFFKKEKRNCFWVHVDKFFCNTITITKAKLN